MNEEKANYHPLFVTALLICAGLISPSDGVDDRTYKTPIEMISIMVIAISAGVVAFSIWKIASNYGWTSNTNSQENNSLNK